MHLASVAVICSVLLVSDAFFFPPNRYPEMDMDVPQMIRYQGYPVEEHTVQTEDGYRLQIHRIPAGRNDDPNSYTAQKSVIFLQHGLMCDSSNWVINMANESFGFILADAGFDVWMGNVRGNSYGLQNIYYSTDSDAFWDFSFDKMSKYDLPAMLNFVLQTTSQTSLYYVGHSQGTTIGFAEFSTNKELAGKVKKFFALAPVARIGHVETPMNLLGLTSASIKITHDFLGKRGVLPRGYNAMMNEFALHVCTNVIGEAFCTGTIFMVCGSDIDGLNTTRLPVYYAHTPSDTSVKDVIHWLQRDPPTYNLQEVDLPVALYSGSNDWLADPIDVAYLASQLPNMSHEEIPGWNHVDFIWGMQAPTLYHKIINDIKSASAK
ncbi:lysosomal acid lipase/cholesteryl ester hydrolase-like isoform X2 [Montipora foliosa]|uniref:lysosomal acid lipase/cholesteryl ester hydrolase-like isoform X2 n=1 Tax=Montipora foliosa TaxID=591990 RepID=UPI0035F113DF